MTDTCSQELRSEIMARIRSKDTKPEMIVRRLIHGMGYRYRLHVRKLPGSPDIVMTSRRKIIEVRGCFWHGHKNCKNARIPKSRIDFWTRKIKNNQDRDSANKIRLEATGWKLLEIWECETRNIAELKVKLETFIENN